MVLKFPTSSLLCIAELTRDVQCACQVESLENLSFRCSGTGVSFIYDEQMVYVQIVTVRDSWSQTGLNSPAHVHRTFRLLKGKLDYFLYTGPIVTSSMTIKFKFIHLIQYCFKSVTPLLCRKPVKSQQHTIYSVFVVFETVFAKDYRRILFRVSQYM